ncbi:hypothetical protein ACIBCL_09430 [Micromonospora zamorensis]|uniref:hypothetical protein n=1 Tax=Micromonospora zamorensis TaxID=709883 RepID=UPI0037A75B10
MSYDMFVQRFEQGDAAPMPGDAFRAVFEPRADRREPQHGYWHISADGGGTADVYATLTDDTLRSLMISRFSAGAILDMLVKFVGLADAVVLPPGCHTLLAHESQRCHLPEGLRADAVVVRRARTWSASFGAARRCVKHVLRRICQASGGARHAGSPAFRRLMRDTRPPLICDTSAR